VATELKNGSFFSLDVGVEEKSEKKNFEFAVSFFRSSSSSTA